MAERVLEAVHLLEVMMCQNWIPTLPVISELLGRLPQIGEEGRLRVIREFRSSPRSLIVVWCSLEWLIRKSIQSVPDSLLGHVTTLRHVFERCALFPPNIGKNPLRRHVSLSPFELLVELIEVTLINPSHARS
jgi:hypothetical protein